MLSVCCFQYDRQRKYTFRTVHARLLYRLRHRRICFRILMQAGGDYSLKAYTAHGTVYSVLTGMESVFVITWRWGR